jgi:tetratricopeptide (TPR) repeat protein
MSYYARLAERGEGEDVRTWAARQPQALARFKADVAGRYREGTLQRLADHPDPRTRRAALVALHLVGTMASNDAVAARLHDGDPQVRQTAADALWALWFRADSEANNAALQRALRQGDPEQALTALNALVVRAPGFAEAINQRAILLFQRREYERCAADCVKVLRLNPQHFGAAAGLGRCYLRLRLPGPALKAFRTAYQINPHVEGVEDVIRDLENVLGEEGTRDDRDR